MSATTVRDSSINAAPATAAVDAHVMFAEAAAAADSKGKSAVGNSSTANSGSGAHLRQGPQPFTCPSFTAFVLLGAIWGSAFTFINFANESFPPFTLVALRLTFGGAGMFLINIVVCWKSPKTWRQVKRKWRPVLLLHFFIMGLFNNSIPFTLVSYAERSINVGVASILDSTIPLFGLIFAHFFLQNERMTWKGIIGLVVGFGGVIMVCMQQVEKGGAVSVGDFLGYILVTLASASYAVASVYARRQLLNFPPLAVACGQMLCGAILNIVGSLACDLKWPPGDFPPNYAFLSTASVKSWLSILYLSGLSTIGAYALYFYLIRTVGSVKQTLVGYLLPVFGIFEGAAFLHEWSGVSWYFIFTEVMGAVLICGGIFIVNLGNKKKEDAKALETLPMVASDAPPESNGDDQRSLLGSKAIRSDANGAYGAVGETTVAIKGAGATASAGGHGDKHQGETDDDDGPASPMTSPADPDLDPFLAAITATGPDAQLVRKEFAASPYNSM